MAPTPKSQDRKRRLSAANANNTVNDSPETPAKKRTGKAKDTVINLDVEDPFNFEKKEDSHPEPLKNISIERSSFGGIKFSRSPNIDRYVSVEKIAERRGNVSGTITSPISSQSGFSLQLTPRSANTSVAIATPKSTKAKRTPARAQVVNETKNEDVEEKIKLPDNISVTSSAKRRQKSAFEASATPKEKKLTLDDYCVVPKLSPTQQLAIDHGSHEHQLLEAGARVFALWGQDYYAANICGRDGLSRYYVHFVEDNLNRLLPPNGVVPLFALKENTEVSFIATHDDQEVGKQAKITSVPSSENAEAWTKGLFNMQVEDEGAFENVPWDKIYLTKDQQKIISALVVNTTVDVEQENIVNESRSSRRSRSARFSLDGNNTNTNQSATPATCRSKTPRVSKTPAKTPATIKEDEEEKVTPVKSIPLKEIETTSRSARASRRSNIATPAKTPKALTKIASKAPAKTPSKIVAKTPSRGNSSRKSTSENEQSTIAENVTETVEEVGDAHVVISENESIETEESASHADVTNEEKMEVDSQTNETVEEIVDSANLQTNDVTDDGVPDDKSLNGKMNVDEDETNSNDDLPSDTIESSEPNINGSSNDSPSEVVERNGNNGTQNCSETVEEQENNGTINGNENSSGKVAPVSEESHNDSTPVFTESTPSSQPQITQSVSISSIPPPADEKEATIFKNMKFVLTSATRSKKNSDFQKRDYRTKIEERGGEIIDDFSSIKDGDNAFLIADTYYRTHKYLSALSISVPCVKHNWIYDCVINKRFLDHMPYMLPAGESSLDQNKICEWRPLKNILLRGKSVWVYSNIPTKSDERAIGFVDIWSSIIKNLGAQIVEKNFSSLMEKLEYCTPVDILLTDSSCDKELAEKVEAEGGIAVSSEWVIQAIVTGELPEVSCSDRFRFDSAA